MGSRERRAREVVGVVGDRRRANGGAAEERDEGKASWPTLYVLDVPVFTLPQATFGLTEGRHSGFMSPARTFPISQTRRNCSELTSLTEAESRRPSAEMSRS